MKKKKTVVDQNRAVFGGTVASAERPVCSAASVCRAVCGLSANRRVNAGSDDAALLGRQSRVQDGVLRSVSLCGEQKRAG